MSSMQPNQSNTDEKETSRIEAFSDGVFSIAITLLVLEIKVPALDDAKRDGLLQLLLKEWHSYFGFSVSFFFILVMWLNHHRLFKVIRRSSDVLLILNGLLLFGISVVPFTTALVSEYLGESEQVIATVIYAAWFFIISIFFNALWIYASRDNRMFTEKTDQRLARHISWQYAFGPVSYLIAVVVAFFSPLLSIAITFALGIFYLLPSETFQQLLARKESRK